MNSSSPRYGEKASYYSAVCLETGEVEWMDLEGNSNSGTSAAFLDQLRQRHSGPLQVIWDNAPAHRGEAVREYLRRPGLGLRLVNLPGYSPDFNADEAIWGWAGGDREPVLGKQSGGAGEGGQLPGQAGQPERRGQAPLPHGPAIKGRIPPARLPARSPTSGKCTSHLGFGLVTPPDIYPVVIEVEFGEPAFGDDRSRLGRLVRGTPFPVRSAIAVGAPLEIRGWSNDQLRERLAQPEGLELRYSVLSASIEGN